MFAEGAHPYQGQFPAEEIYKLGQFVDPHLAQDLAPGGDAEVVFELAAFLQVVGLIHVILQVFAVGMHGAELFHIDDPAVPAQAFQADKGAVGGVGIGARRPGLFQDEVHLAGDLALVDQFETAKIEPAKHLGLGEGAVPPAGEGEIPALQHRQLGHHAAKEEIEEIGDRAKIRCERGVKHLLAFGDGLPFADENTAVLQQLVDLDQVEVDPAQIVDLAVVEKHLAGAGFLVLDVVIILRIQDEGAGFVKTSEVQILVDEIKQLFAAVQIVLPEGNEDAVLGLALGVGRGVADVADGGHQFAAIQIEFWALRLFQRRGAGNEPGFRFVAALPAEPDNVVEPHQHEDLQQHAAQDGAQHDHA